MKAILRGTTGRTGEFEPCQRVSTGTVSAQKGGQAFLRADRIEVTFQVESYVFGGRRDWSELLTPSRVIENVLVRYYRVTMD